MVYVNNLSHFLMGAPSTMMTTAATLSLLMSCANTAIANTPWVMEAESSSLYYSFVSEAFDEKYLGEEDATSIADIEQTTHWIHYFYGLNERLTLSVQTGYTQSEWDGSDYEYSGRADSRLGATYEWMNQFVDERAWTVSLYGALTLAGTYERGAPGRPHAPGDGADGVEAALLAGRQISETISTQATFGLRLRGDDVPDEIYYGGAFHFSLSSQLTGSLAFDAIRALDGSDIPNHGGEFHKTHEDRATLDAVLSYNLAGFTLIGGYAQVIDISGIAETRNTGKSEILHFSIGYHY